MKIAFAASYWLRVLLAVPIVLLAWIIGKVLDVHAKLHGIKLVFPEW